MWMAKVSRFASDLGGAICHLAVEGAGINHRPSVLQTCHRARVWPDGWIVLSRGLGNVAPRGSGAMTVRKFVRFRRGQPQGLLRWLAVSGAAGLTGCAVRSAPAAVVFGAYFPDWLLFAIFAIVAAIMARVAVGIAGFAGSVPFPLFTYLAIGIVIAGAVDLLWLGH